MTPAPNKIFIYRAPAEPLANPDDELGAFWWYEPQEERENIKYISADYLLKWAYPELEDVGIGLNEFDEGYAQGQASVLTKLIELIEKL